MKVDTSNFLSDSIKIKSNIIDLTSSKDIKIFNNSETNQDTNISINGSNATISINNNAQNPIVPGFIQYNLTITTKEKQTFNISIHIDKNANKEYLDKALTKLMKILSNMNKDTLNDLGLELKHILLTDNIIFNKQASGMAIGPLNQMFLSTEKLAKMSDEECLTTITHELGHLIDYSNAPMLRGKATQWYKSEFNNLTKSLDVNLDFKTDSHMFDNCSELFADYYAYTAGTLIDTPTRKAKTQFDLLEKYTYDLENLSSEEIEAKYGEHVNSVKQVATAWKTLKGNFHYYLGNLKTGYITKEDRADVNTLPQNYEQLIESQKQNQ